MKTRITQEERMKQEITQEDVIKIFDYDKETGLLIRKSLRNRSTKGLELNCNREGYIQVYVNGRTHGAHRIIWLHQYGYMPRQIDHINHYKADNRLDNLREVTITENNRNMSLGRNNITSVRGVSWNRHDLVWKAQISYNNNKIIHLGNFQDFYEAIAYRLAAEQCIDWNSFKHSSSALEQMSRYLYS